MILLGLLLAIAGFVLSVLSLGLTSSVGVRLVMVLAGLAISLTGIIGVMNRGFLKTAIWRR